jgi:hypothetical protein
MSAPQVFQSDNGIIKLQDDDLLSKHTQVDIIEMENPLQQNIKYIFIFSVNNVEYSTDIIFLYFILLAWAMRKFLILLRKRYIFSYNGLFQQQC